MRKRIFEIIEVALPGDRVSKIYDIFMLLCIVASIVPLCFRESNAAFEWIDKITVTVFIIASGFTSELNRRRELELQAKE